MVKQGTGNSKDRLSAHDMLTRLGKAHVEVFVEVVLVVATARQENHFLPSASDLQDCLRLVTEGFSVDGEGGIPLTLVNQARDNEVFQLAIRQQIIFASKAADQNLRDDVSEAVKSAIDKATGEGKSPQDLHLDTPLRVSSTAVDEVLKSDCSKNRNGYTLYLLYPDISEKYIYAHEQTTGASGLPIGSENHGKGSDKTYPTGCGYIGWIGERERYAWLDLGAHVDEGWRPKHRASGIVSSSTLPGLPERHSFWVGPKLAAIVHRTTHQLLAPLLLYSPGGMGSNFGPLMDHLVPDNVFVQVYIVCAVKSRLNAEKQAWEESLVNRLREPGEGVESGLMPTVEVNIKPMWLFDHPLVATGIHQATYKHVLGSNESWVLVAAELRNWLRLLLEEKRQAEDDAEGDNHRRIVPLFVLSFDSDLPVVFDDSTRSVAFPDMVISVKSRAVDVPSAFRCGSRTIVLPGNRDRGDGHDENDVIDDSLLRETVASLAQLIWGVIPRELAWDSLSQAVETDYLWATGASMHTPLSSHMSLTFNERDAYPRARILRRADAAVRAALDVLDEAATVQSDLTLVLNNEDVGKVERLWEEVEKELKDCLGELAAHHHDNAIEHTSRLESTVKELERVMSNGYLESEFRPSCACGPAGGGLSDRQIVVAMIFDFCFLVVSLLTCAVLVSYVWSRLKGLTGKHKRS